MTRIGLTPTQAQLFAFIEAEIRAGRSAPTFDEMMAHMGFRSKSGVHRLLSGLEERGHILRLPNRARAIALVGQDAAPVPAPAPVLPKEADRPRIGISRQVAEQLSHYCLHRRLSTRDVLAAAVTDYMERHP